MYMAKCCPLMALVPISLLLTASFFVLFTLRKATEKWLKALGYLAVSLLLLTVLVIFSRAASNISNGFGGMKCTMMQKMQMGNMQRMMQQGDMPCMAMSDKKELTK